MWETNNACSLPKVNTLLSFFCHSNTRRCFPTSAGRHFYTGLGVIRKKLCTCVFVFDATTVAVWSAQGRQHAPCVSRSWGGQSCVSPEVGNWWAILRAILRLPNLPPSVKPCSHSDGLRWIEPAGWAYTKTWTNKDTKIMRTSVKPCSHSDRLKRIDHPTAALSNGLCPC